jgi:hypothetical protein
MLELLARARPLPTARVRLDLQPEGAGTRVTMIEDPASRLLTLLAGPVIHPTIRIRNSHSLEGARGADDSAACPARAGAQEGRPGNALHADVSADKQLFG